MTSLALSTQTVHRESRKPSMGFSSGKPFVASSTVFEPQSLRNCEKALMFSVKNSTGGPPGNQNDYPQDLHREKVFKQSYGFCDVCSKLYEPSDDRNI